MRKILIIIFSIAILLHANLAMAAFTAASPVRANENLHVATISNQYLYAVGDNGAIYQTNDQNNLFADTVQLTRKLSTINENLVAITPLATGFAAAGDKGSIVYTKNNGGLYTTTAPPNGAGNNPFSGGSIVGIIAHSAGNAFYVLNSRGKLWKYTIGSKTWTNADTATGIGNTAMALSSAIRGMTYVNDTYMVCFGDYDGTNNLYRVTLADGAVQGVTVGTAETNIWAMDVTTPTSWTVTGIKTGTNVAYQGTGDLITPANTAAEVIFDTASTHTLSAVDYDNTKSYGMAISRQGEFREISTTVGTAKDSLSGVFINDVVVAFKAGADLKRTFVVGNEGLVKYGNDSCWQQVIFTKDYENAMLAGLGSSTILLDSGTGHYLYKFDDETTPIIETAIPAGASDLRISFNSYSWEPSTLAYRSGSDSIRQVLIRSGKTTPALQTHNDGADTFEDMITFGDNRELVTAYRTTGNVKKIKIGIPAVEIASDGGISLGLKSGANPIQLFKRGGILYALDTNDSNTIKVLVHNDRGTIRMISNPTSTDAPTCHFVKAGASDIQIDLAGNEKLIQMADFPAWVKENTTDFKYLAGFLGENIPINLRGLQAKTALPSPWVTGKSKLSGMFDNVYYTDGNNVWSSELCYAVTKWIKLGSAAAAVGSNGVKDLAGGSRKPLIRDDSAPTPNFYTASSSPFTTADVTATGVAALTNLNSIYSADKDTVYAGGDGGTIYKGTIGTNKASINWTKETTSFIGTYKVREIAGHGNNIFAVYGADGNYMAVKKGPADFSKLNVQINGVDRNDSIISNICAVAEDTVYAFIDSGGVPKALKLMKGTYNVGNINFIPEKDDRPQDLVVSNYAFTADRLTMYAIEKDKASLDLNKLLKLTYDTGNSRWTKVVPDAQIFTNVAGNVITLEDKVYVIAQEGVFCYDGTTLTKLADDIRDNNTGAYTDSWAYGTVLYATTDDNKVYSYNFKSKVKGVDTNAAGKSVRSIAGNEDGQYVVVVGDGNMAEIAKISKKGGGETDSSVWEKTGDSAVVAANPPEKKTRTELAQMYHTPEDIDVCSEVQSFTTSGGIPAATVHVFAFNFTPEINEPLASVTLYKLLPGSSDYATYSRIESAPATPASGTCWFETTAGEALGTGDTLLAGTTYTVFFAIKDGDSTYDADSIVSQITDPTFVGTTSSSSGSGCTMNPVAGFGLEWILLTIAPALITLRSRFKK